MTGRYTFATAWLPHACMGGWCVMRDTCARYHAIGIERMHAAERLCPPGQDGVAWAPVTWRAGQRAAMPPEPTAELQP
ncbi:MAG: hypothetical protein LCI02_04905 [Proteobacteria bacterium]|nr:hypothetical protein [Pseudomonadota bacterium]